MSDLLLETERLYLRPPAQEDAPAHAEMMADPLTAQFLTFDGKPQDRMIAWRTWATLSGHWNFRGFGFFSMIDKETGRFHPPATLQRRFSEAGIDIHRPVITHCQSGGRASVMAFAIELMGGQAANYYRGWSEWGNTDDTPVERSAPRKRQP